MNNDNNDKKCPKCGGKNHGMARFCQWCAEPYQRNESDEFVLSLLNRSAHKKGEES